MKKLLAIALATITLSACAPTESDVDTNTVDTQDQVTTTTTTTEETTTTTTEEPTTTEAPTTTTTTTETTTEMTTTATTEETTVTTTEAVSGGTFSPGEAVTLGDYTFKIISFEVVPTWDDGNALKFTYEWTNNSDETASPFLTYMMKGFQNGVEVDTTPLTDDIDYGLGQRDVRPGTTITGEGGLEIEDMNAPLELELQESFSFTGEPFIYVIEDLSSLD